MSETNNIYLQQNTRVGIYVGPGVLDLAGLQEDWWDQHVELGDKFEQFVVREMLESELPLTGVSGVSLAEDSVTVARDDLSRLEKTPNKLLHLVVSGVQTHSSHHLLHEDEHLLVGETVERPGQPAHPGAEGEVGVRQSRAHQVSGVGRHVAALVVTESSGFINHYSPDLSGFLGVENLNNNQKGQVSVRGKLSPKVPTLLIKRDQPVNGEIKSHQLSEHGILVADHLGEVVGPVLVGVDGAGGGALPEQVVVDGGSDHGQLGNHVHGILKS